MTLRNYIQIQLDLLTFYSALQLSNKEVADDLRNLSKKWSNLFLEKDDLVSENNTLLFFYSIMKDFFENKRSLLDRMSTSQFNSILDFIKTFKNLTSKNKFSSKISVLMENDISFFTNHAFTKHLLLFSSPVHMGLMRKYPNRSKKTSDSDTTPTQE
jgi:hypothetical protein